MFTWFFQSLFENVGTPSSGVPRHAVEAKKNFHNVVVCRTNDEVNVDLACAWCDEHGLVCRQADQRDELFFPDAHALVLDLNHLTWGPTERAQLVEQLCHALLPYPVAIASYDLDVQEKSALEVRGFLVFRRIDRQLLDALARARVEHFATSRNAV